MSKFSTRLPFFLSIGVFAILWLDLVRQLSYVWSTNETYAYGCFVPALSVALFWRGWTDRPSAQPVATPTWMLALVFIAVLALLPARVIEEINQDWPLSSWSLSLIVVGLSLYAIFLGGGWPWVKHFGFAVCFILVAVCWPDRIEHSLTINLMRIVTRLTSETLQWVGIPAIQHGNLIELSTGVVGTEEACSGIRSFQSTLMAALFLGQLYRLTLPRRSSLLAGGLILAFILNVLRTFILTWRAASAGIEALEKLHDLLGEIVFLTSLTILWSAAVLLQSKSRNATTVTDPNSVPAGSRTLLTKYLLAIGSWSLCVIGFTAWWYRAHDPATTDGNNWSIALPEDSPGFEKIAMAPRTLKLLAFDQGVTGKWLEENGCEWSAFFFRWSARSIRSVIQSRRHRPDVCLPAAGFRQVSDTELNFVTAGNLALPFRRFIYEAQGHMIYVYFCRWEEGARTQQGLSASTQSDRLQAVLSGRSSLGQQTLEIILTGYESKDQADQDFGRRLPHLIKIERPEVNLAQS